MCVLLQAVQRGALLTRDLLFDLPTTDQSTRWLRGGNGETDQALPVVGDDVFAWVECASRLKQIDSVCEGEGALKVKVLGLFK